MNTLKETVDAMLSDDYKERFRAEYHQLRIRYDKLHDMVTHWDELQFTPTCCIDIYQNQLEYMSKYMFILRYRADLEHIKL